MQTAFSSVYKKKIMYVLDYEFINKFTPLFTGHFKLFHCAVTLRNMGKLNMVGLGYI